MQRSFSKAIKLIDDMEIRFSELPKLDDTLPSQGGLENWLWFLSGVEFEHWEALKTNEPKLDKAMDTLQYLSQDSKARRLYEARQCYLHDEASMRHAGMQEGVEKVARNLLRLNLDMDTIIQATGLTEQEVLALKE